MSVKHSIFIVDDDADDREILKDAFHSILPQHQYVLLENGDQLLEHLQQNGSEDHPSIILLDLNMPGKDGRETLKEIKSNEKYFHIPIVIFTTSSSPRDKTLCYESGANCFITKPDTFNKMVELANAVHRLWLIS